jgi:predicted lipoprotein with Yx(FWY)xxD motif
MKKILYNIKNYHFCPVMKISYIVLPIAIIVAVIGGLLFGVFFMLQNAPGAHSKIVVSSVNNNTNSISAPSTASVTRKPTVNFFNDSKLGPRLVAANGLSLYSFAKDSPGVSACTGACATNWPAYIVSADFPLVLGEGVTGKLNTIDRVNGTHQVTYKGMPLYFWQTDTEAGDVYGYGIDKDWTVAKP